MDVDQPPSIACLSIRSHAALISEGMPYGVQHSSRLPRVCQTGMNILLKTCSGLSSYRRLVCGIEQCSDLSSDRLPLCVGVFRVKVPADVLNAHPACDPVTKEGTRQCYVAYGCGYSPLDSTACIGTLVTGGGRCAPETRVECSNCPYLQPSLNMQQLEKRVASCLVKGLYLRLIRTFSLV